MHFTCVTARFTAVLPAALLIYGYSVIHTVLHTHVRRYQACSWFGADKVVFGLLCDKHRMPTDLRRVSDLLLEMPGRLPLFIRTGGSTGFITQYCRSFDPSTTQYLRAHSTLRDCCFVCAYKQTRSPTLRWGNCWVASRMVPSFTYVAVVYSFYLSAITLRYDNSTDR